MKTPLCGMLTLAAIYFTAQTTTPPTGKVGINTTTPTETLDVKGKVRIQGLYSENDQTGTKLSETDDNKTFTATDVVTANANGVLGKKSLSSIIATQTPNFPWKKVGTENENAVPASGLKIYSKYAVGIGDYSSTSADIGSSFEISGGGTSQLGLINGTSKWDISTEDKSLTFTKRKPENGRIFSITDKAIIYLGNTLLSQDGSGAKLILDGGNGKIGINQNSASYNLDVAGDAKISGLKSGTGYTATHMVVADANGVLGKQDFPSIPTIPTEPWNKLGGTTQATANTDNIYQNGKVGIGNYASTSTFDSDFEVNSNRNGYHIGIANGADTKWNLSTENDNEKPFTITRRHSRNNGGEGRVLSLTKDTKLYLGSDIDTNGSRAKILVDGKNGKIGINKNTADHHLDVAGTAKISDNIFLNDKWNIGLKGNSLMFYSSGTKADTNNKFTLTNEGKLFLGKDMNGDGNGTGANVFLDGKDGKVAIGKNSADYKLDVAGDAKISGLKEGTGYTATHMVVADANGVLGKASIPSIPTIPTEPWRQLGGTNEATANTQNIYQNGKVGIGNYTSISTFESDFEVNSNRNGYQIGIANGDSKWNLSTESGDERAFTITKRHPNNQGRLLSLDKDAKLYLGNALFNTSGNGAKILLDGGQGKVAIGKNSAEYNLDVAGNAGIKGQLNLIDSSNDNNKFLTYTEGTQLLFDKKIAVPILHTTQTGVMASLTNVGKLYLGNNLTKPNGETIYTENAKIFLNGEEGKVAIGKNSADYNLDVVGTAKISGLPNKDSSDTVKMVVVDNSGVLKKADIPTGGGSGNGVTKHDSSSTPQCNAANAGTIHYKEGVTVNGTQTSVMGFCMKTSDSKYRWFYIFGGAGTTTGSKEDAPTFGVGL